jgi:hypothetical protein
LIYWGKIGQFLNVDGGAWYFLFLLNFNIEKYQASPLFKYGFKKIETQNNSQANSWRNGESSNKQTKSGIHVRTIKNYKFSHHTNFKINCVKTINFLGIHDLHPKENFKIKKLNRCLFLHDEK